MARCQGRVTGHVLLLRPTGFDNDWSKTDLWESARAIPGVRAMLDEDSREAGRFRVVTSGHTLLYDSSGRLLFSGGITASRGHSGDNLGRSTIVSLLTESASRKPDTSECCVYGCPLFDAPQP